MPMKVNGNAVRIGNIIEHQKKLWIVTKTQHVKPGKGGAFNQVELKAVVGTTKLHERFRSDEQVERVFLEEVPFQFLYEEGDSLVFMDQTTFEQLTLSKDLLGDALPFLRDGMEVKLSMYEEKPLSIAMPDSVVLMVEEADPVVKGQTATSSYKPAMLENGVRIMVPPHIESGMRVVVNTDDATYVERFKD